MILKVVAILSLLAAVTGQEQVVFEKNTVITSESLSNSAVSPQDEAPPTVVVCGDSTDIFQLKSVHLNPDPPHRGQGLNVSLSGTLSEDIVEGSYADVKVKLGIIKLYDQRVDLCKEVHEIGEQCPFNKGVLNLEKIVDIPRAVPPVSLFQL